MGGGRLLVALPFHALTPILGESGQTIPRNTTPTAALNPAAAKSNDFACNPKRVATRATPPLQ